MSKRVDQTRVLIAGGGVAALEAALALRALAEERVSVELLGAEPHFWYRPLSVAEPFELGEARHFELTDLASAAGATFSLGTLRGVDAGRREAHTVRRRLALRHFADRLRRSPGSCRPRRADLPRPGRRRQDAWLTRGDRRRHSAAGRLRRTERRGLVAADLRAGADDRCLRPRTRDRREDVEITLVTPEDRPLGLFGDDASDAVRELLDERQIVVHVGAYPAELADGELRLVPGGCLAVDRVVALPRLRGPRLDGVPQTLEGFIPVDEHGRVRGLADVFAAGDITSFPVKQGGIAAQQAEAAAFFIAAGAGADLSPQPFRPVLRGLLLTGRQPRYLRQEITGGAGPASSVSAEPLWWPPAKIVGRYLAPLLCAVAGVDSPAETSGAPGIPVEVELDTARSPSTRFDSEVAGDGRSVGEVMAPALVVAPEDTLGEVAERMRAEDVGSAAVAAYGRLVGILTSRDLLRAFAGRAHPSEARVREWMTAEPVAVAVKTPIEVGVSLMAEHGIHHLPVVDGERAVGMLGFRQAAQARRTSFGLGF